MADKQRIRIDTLTKTPTSTNPNGQTVSSTETRWCEVVWVTPDEAIRRYECELDGITRAVLKFRGRPSITMGKTQFVWATDGNPKETKVYWPRSEPSNVDGDGRYTTVLVEEDRSATA